MLREAEVIVGAKVQHLAPVGELDAHALRRGDETLALPSPGVTDSVELLRKVIFEPAKHGAEAALTAPRIQ